MKKDATPAKNTLLSSPQILRTGGDRPRGTEPSGSGELDASRLNAPAPRA